MSRVISHKGTSYYCIGCDAHTDSDGELQFLLKVFVSVIVTPLYMRVSFDAGRRNTQKHMQKTTNAKLPTTPPTTTTV